MSQSHLYPASTGIVRMRRNRMRDSIQGGIVEHRIRLTPLVRTIYFNHDQYTEHLEQSEIHQNEIICTELRVTRGQHQLDLDNLQVDRFVFPGGGENYEDCGTVRFYINCVGEGKWLGTAYNHCDRPECYTCSKDWRRRASNRATEQIWQILQLAKKHVNHRFSLSSVVVSVPENLYELTIDELWARFRRVLDKLGTRHVVAVLHLFRFRDLQGNEVAWREFIQHPEKYQVIRSPHFHCIIMGRMVNSKRFYEATDWVYKKLGGYLDRHDVFEIVNYALSHTQVSLDRQLQLIRYYGHFKTARIESEHVEIERVLCPDCGGFTERHYPGLKVVDGVPCQGFREPHYHTVITRTWCLHLKHPS